MYGVKFINYNDPLNLWTIDRILEISSKLDEYCKENKIEDAELVLGEDSRWSDPRNERFDIEIRYIGKDGIKKHMYDIIKDMHCDTYEKNELTKSVCLEDVPLYEEVLEHVTKGEKIFLKSQEEVDTYGSAHELEFTYNPEEKRIVLLYGYGQISYHGSYIISEIPEDRVHYLVVENFLAPAKGVPSVQRMFHEPYTTETAARKAGANLKKHESHGSKIEILVSNKDIDEKSEWFKINMEAVELMKRAPEAQFNIFIKPHLDILKRALAEKA